ncbi:MAG: 3'(2'),5'-bisphosphate nucleotidase CysQ [Bacteroidales bacterium]|nr:3'(2'),5'-bisphosphate nucleotidase CysQ [Bacteroidales bacterium]
MSNIDFELLLPRVIKTAIEAGKATLEVYNSDFSVQTKSDDSPLTLADQRSHEIIEAELTSTLIPILSEEGRDIPYSERKSWTYFWLIDPLDGTKEFVKRNSEFTVNIALIHESEAILGVIYVPVYDLLYFANEKGSFKLEKASEFISNSINLNSIINISCRLPLQKTSESDEIIVVASKSHLNQKTADYIKSLSEIHSNVRSVSRGSSLKLCLVAEGSADLYPRFGPTMEWDIAAGSAIIKFAGATIETAREQLPLLFNKQSLINPEFIAKRK